MKIAIDISQIVYETGVSTYTKKLVENLIKIDKTNEYVLFAGSLRRKADILKVFPNTKVFPIPPILADLIWNRLHVLPIEKLIGTVDVFHSSDWTEPPASAFKVTTVHDLYVLKYPKLVDPVVLEAHKKKLGWVLKESRRMIVPSESTKADLVTLGVAENVIRVIPEAPTLSKATSEEVEKTKKKFQINGDYLVSIGVTPLKNTKRIIDAFHLAKSGRDLKLLVIGRPINVDPQLERGIRFLGHVETKEVAALLTGSKGLVFASLYEGYGLPILDAFACGVPVVTSDTASMPEVAGGAAVLVDPNDTNSIADGIRKMLAGPKGLTDKGSERVKNFSWEKTARMTLDVYNEAKP